VIAHVGGVPVEETLALGPALLVAVGALAATIRAWPGELARRRRARHP
jgi:hypothetical protein